MMEIKSYMNDGANYQAQMILCYLRSKQCHFEDWCHLEGEQFEWVKNSIQVGRFENCREQGYIFGINVRGYIQRNDFWMVVEHRSSDSIKIRHFRANTINTPNINVAYDDELLVEEKWFSCEDIIKAGDYILDGMEDSIDEYVNSDEFQSMAKDINNSLGKES